MMLHEPIERAERLIRWIDSELAQAAQNKIRFGKCSEVINKINTDDANKLFEEIKNEKSIN